jgi:hypothetical protein
MKAKLLFAAVMIVTLAGSAHADFYVVENQSTHTCTVVTQQPMPGMIDRVVGDAGYKSQQEAEFAMRGALACSNTPAGNSSSTTSSGNADRTSSKCGSYLAQWPCRR